MRTGGRVARAVALTVLLLAASAGCALLSPLHVEHARTGEVVVRATAPTSFDRVAEAVYGEPKLGRQVASLVHLPYEEGVPRGTVLVLPIRDELEGRLENERASSRAFEEGLAAGDAGSYRTAAERFRQALRESPHRLDVRYNLGLALMQAGELEDATAILETVARARPEDASSRYAFGSVLRKRRAFDRAYREFEAALRADPRDAKAAFARARTLEDLGRYGRAERAWESFLVNFRGSPLEEAARRNLEELRLREAEAAADSTAADSAGAVAPVEAERVPGSEGLPPGDGTAGGQLREEGGGGESPEASGSFPRP